MQTASASTVSPRNLALCSALRRLVWSKLAAQSAEQIAFAATPFVAVTALGAGPGATGLLSATQTVAFLVLAISGYLLADRATRRTAMVAAESIRVVALVVVG